MKKGKSHFHSNAEVCAGRLLVDTEVISKELVHEKNYSLGELSRSLLKTSVSEIEADQVKRYYSSHENLMSLLLNNSQNAWYNSKFYSILM